MRTCLSFIFLLSIESIESMLCLQSLCNKKEIDYLGQSNKKNLCGKSNSTSTVINSARKNHICRLMKIQSRQQFNLPRHGLVFMWSCKYFRNGERNVRSSPLQRLATIVMKRP